MMLLKSLLTLLFFCSAYVTAYVQIDAARQVKCSSAGYFAYPDDCTRFYRCVDYFGTGTRFTAFHFICPLGTVFDESISVCNHPEWVKAPSRCAGQFQQNGNLPAAGPIVVPAGSGIVSPVSPVPPKPSPEPQTTPEAVKPESGTVEISTSSSTAALVDLSSPASVSVTESSESSAEQTTPASASVESSSPASASVTESSESSVEQTTPASASVDSSTAAPLYSSSVSSVDATTPSEPVDESGASSPGVTTLPESVDSSSASSVDVTTPSESVDVSSASSVDLSTTSESVSSSSESSVEVTTPSESVDVSSVEETTPFELVDTSSESSLDTTTPSESVDTFSESSPDVTTPSESVDTFSESSPDVTTPSESVESVDFSSASPIDETVPSETTDVSSSSIIDSSTEPSPEESTDASTDSSIDESTDSSAAVPSESSTVPPVSVSTTEPEIAETTSSSTNPENSTQSTTASPQESSAAPEATSSSLAPVSSPVTSFPTFFLACGGKDYYRHPLSCNRFYQCLWDGATINVVMFACGEGLVFDEPTKQCTTPDKTSPCKEMTSTTAAPVSVTQATTELSKPVNPSNNYTVTEDSLYHCPRPGHFAYELDCIRFYRCFEVTAGVLKGVLYRCPVGYSYSAQTERCQKQGDLAVCDKTLLNIFSRIPVPQIPLEQTPVVREEDLDRFFSDLKLFYSPAA